MPQSSGPCPGPAKPQPEDRAEPEGNNLTDKQPNIVVFFWDNLGWGELGCYGGGLGWAIRRAHERGETGTTVKFRLARPPALAAGPGTA